MLYTAIAGLLIIVALAVLYFALRLLFGSNWLLGFLRGAVGLGFVAVGIMIVLIAMDLYSYRQLAKEEAIANLSFTKLDPQHYRVNLVSSSGEELEYELRGDLWQLDARILKWSEGLARMGIMPGYRLDRLSGRYMSLEEEQRAERTVYSLSESKSVFDVWEWLHESGSSNALLDAAYGSATYLPMEDGALFSVTLSHSGLVARPLNDRAKAAVERWN